MLDARRGSLGRAPSGGHPERRTQMSVVKIITLVGESKKGWQDAADSAIKEAQKTLRGITRIGVV